MARAYLHRPLGDTGTRAPVDWQHLPGLPNILIPVSLCSMWSRLHLSELYSFRVARNSVSTSVIPLCASLTINLATISVAGSWRIDSPSLLQAASNAVDML